MHSLDGEIRARHSSLPESEIETGYPTANLMNKSQEPILTAVALKVVGDRTQQTGLASEIHNLVTILQEEGSFFSDILEALSDYSLEESVEIPSEQKTWEVVGSLLKVAASQAETQQSAINKVALRLLQVPSKRLFLVPLLRQLISVLQTKNYRFSDILFALIEYALQESAKNKTAKLSWETVAYLLKLAAEEAETKGRELP